MNAAFDKATFADAPTVASDLCECGHWSRHHSVGKHGGCGHCTCRKFDPARVANDQPLATAPHVSWADIRRISVRIPVTPFAPAVPPPSGKART